MSEFLLPTVVNCRHLLPSAGTFLGRAVLSKHLIAGCNRETCGCKLSVGHLWTLAGAAHYGFTHHCDGGRMAVGLPSPELLLRDSIPQE